MRRDKLGTVVMIGGAFALTISATFLAFFGGLQEAIAASAQPVAALEVDNPEATATFAAGCFWGVEHAFRNVEGVIETAVGYTGGHVDSPTYRQVCADKTGHAEAVHVRFDPERVSYEDLLHTFWTKHDPTQLNRQGPDRGTQYRSAIYFHTPEQERAALASMARVRELYDRPVVTEIEPAETFWQAEVYHQQYYEKSGQPSCLTQ
jgi:peptide-methionine (S)-S-oxide reductase